MAYGSSKTGIASGIRTPCLRKSIPALLSSSHSNPSIFIVRTLCAYVKVGYCAVFVLIAICNILEEVPFNPDLDCFIQASAVLGLELDLTVGRALHQLDSATNAL